MSNPPRKKGTAGETELLRLIEKVLGSDTASRMPMGSRYDIQIHANGHRARVLATRPDRGEWLVTMDLDTFLQMLWSAPGWGAEIEVKRRKTLAHHTMFDKEVVW